MNPIPPSRSTAIQLAVGLASFLTPFLNGALSVAIPAIGQTFALYPRELPLIVLAQLIPATAFMAVFGRLSDVLGHKRIFLMGSGMFVLGSLGAGLAEQTWQFVAARAVQGLGDSMTFGVSVAVLSDTVPEAKRGKALGLNLAFIFGGLAVGPIIGGMLTAWWSWRAIFVTSAMIGVAALALILRNHPPDAPRPGARFDRRGAVLYIPAMFGCVLGLALQPSWPGLVSLAAAAWLGTLFVRGQRGQEEALIPHEIFGENRVFAWSSLAAILGFTGAFSTSFLLSLYLQGVKGVGAHETGWFLLIQPAVQALFSPVAGTFSDRFNPARLSMAGLGILGACLWVLASFGPGTPLPWLVAVQVVMGVGFSLFASPNMNAIMGSVPPQRRGLASGLMATMRALGMCLSMAFTGVSLALFTLGGRPGEVGPEAGPGLTAAFALFGAFAFAAAWAALRGGKD